jgi:tetratricopeptide (TPR) repeat protein
VLLAKNDTANALVGLNAVLGSRPNDSSALQTRSLVWLAMHSYENALDDLNKAIAQHETVEVYFARAKIYEAQNKLDKAADDYRRAIELPAATAFDVLAQAAAKQKTQQISKKVPCGNSTGAGTCL